ncbi:hypothetical protein AY608_12710 [Acinetobacter terrae]|nr:hypothetical protein AY608_12710 [Acinetobacter terrae]
MTEKLYYWAENLEDYTSDNATEYDEIIEVKRLNFFIGKNNAGKSRFLRSLFSTNLSFEDLNFITCSEELVTLKDTVIPLSASRINIGNTHGNHFHGQLLSEIGLPPLS